eukprot:COSAG02_NODE_7588_length_2945_cov_4.708607_3_plen_179_part_00
MRCCESWRGLVPRQGQHIRRGRSWRVQSVCGRAGGGSAAYHRRQCHRQTAVARCARPLHKRLALQAEALHTIPTCIEYCPHSTQPHTHARTHARTHSATKNGRCSACLPTTVGWNEHILLLRSELAAPTRSSLNPWERGGGGGLGLSQDPFPSPCSSCPYPPSKQASNDPQPASRRAC